MYLFLAFLLVPIIEIALFIQVGGLIGLWPTLAIVVLTAVLGTALVRTQGRMAHWPICSVPLPNWTTRPNRWPMAR